MPRSAFFCLLACLVFAAVGSAWAEPVPVIFDTDMDTDCDDAGALAVLHALADLGEVEILATVVSSRFRWSVPCTAAINRYHGRPDLPLGAPKGPGPNTGNRGSKYAREISEQFPGKPATNDNAEDAVAVYRRLLAARESADVVIVSVGYVTNLDALLSSEADDISPLTGPELIRRGVKHWVCMGGRYPNHLDPAVYGNFKPDPAAAVRAARDWPTTVYFTGLGNDVHTGSRLPETPKENPVRIIYERYVGAGKTRPSWDPIAVLFAARPTDPAWSVHTGGHNHIFENGTNEWREGEATHHRRIDFAGEGEMKESKAAVKKTLDELMIRPPGKQ